MFVLLVWFIRRDVYFRDFTSSPVCCPDLFPQGEKPLSAPAIHNLPHIPSNLPPFC
jgi:hypothetical protein